MEINTGASTPADRRPPRTRAVLAAAILAIGLAIPQDARAHNWTPSKSNCGWTTCTMYWSVSRTAHLQSGHGGHISNACNGTAAALGVLSLVLPPVGFVALEATLKCWSLQSQLSNAARGRRCLIYKHVRGVPAGGWFGSVALSNSRCD